MKKTVSILLILAMLLFAGCSTNAEFEYGFTNSGFESGTLRGWTGSGEIFEENCIDLSTSDSSGNKFYQEGDFFYYGKRAGNTATGFIKSSVFTLKGNGKIGFLIGAGKNPDKCYIALCDAKKDTELVKLGNTRFDELVGGDTLYRTIIDGSKYKGKKVYMKIVDNDNEASGFNYLNADDFIVNYQGVEDEMGKLFLADKYVESNKNSVNPLYRHNYHIMPPVGWMNDPNGVSYALGKYHVFYQQHPYSTSWGPMHWGHYTSADMITWTREKTALAPDKEYDKDGCFSGSAIEKDGKMYLMYTSVADGRQTQSIAVSDDGVSFAKLDTNPVISFAKLPAGASQHDFRDPKVFKRGDNFYSLIGSKYADGNGQLLLYKSSNLNDWSYVGTSIKDGRTNGIYECPDFFTINGTDIIVTSPQGFAKSVNMHENIHGNIYITGALNLSSGAFAKTYESEIDGGFDFYAPQTLIAPDGRIVMVAWMQMWGRTMPTQAHGWAGAMTIPREITLENGKLIQKPVREIENYRANKVDYSNKTIDSSLTLNGVEGRCLELELELDLSNAQKAGVKLFKSADTETLVYYDKAINAVVFDRSAMGTRISGEEMSATIRTTDVPLEDGKVRFRIFLDNSSAEIFVNGGRYALTGNVYSGTAAGIEFFSSGGSAVITSLTKHDIVIG